MKVREYEAFKAVYCGLCHTLAKRHGLFSRFILNFDFTFLAMLLSDGASPCYRRCRCIASPFKRKPCLESGAAMELAADYSVILCWWKLRDTINDEGFFTSLAARAACLFLRGAYRRAAAERKGFDEMVERRLAELQALEAEKCASLDRVCDKFALILSACADYCANGAEKRALEQLLYHAGRTVYILDAIDDLERDMRHGAYNPVALRFDLSAAKLAEKDAAQLETTLRHSSNLIVSAFELLPAGPFSGILRNIIYEGIPWVSGKVMTGEWRKSDLRKRKERG